MVLAASRPAVGALSPHVVSPFGAAVSPARRRRGGGDHAPPQPPAIAANTSPFLTSQPMARWTVERLSPVSSTTLLTGADAHPRRAGSTVITSATRAYANKAHRARVSFKVRDGLPLANVVVGLCGFTSWLEAQRHLTSMFAEAWSWGAVGDEGAPELCFVSPPDPCQSRRRSYVGAARVGAR